MQSFKEGSVEMKILKDKIREIVPKIKDYQKMNVHEAGTKAGLIEPLFKEIGWDFSDIYSVEPEFPVIMDGLNNPADYALKFDKKIKLFIEAKRINAEIKTAINAGTKKAIEKSVIWLIATNGNAISVLKIDKKIPEQERTIFQIILSDIVNDEQALTEAENLLQLLSPENVESGDFQRFAEKELRRKRITNVITSVYYSKSFEELIQEKYKMRYPKDKLDPNDLKQIIRKIGLSAEKPTILPTQEPEVADPEIIRRRQDRIFNPPNNNDQEKIKKNIWEKRELWSNFIKNKRM